ncbi:MAG TPA: malate synthase A [Polyangiaceae bacterium]|nr:malate synthase A [Polyangiaceae bacterium]
MHAVIWEQVTPLAPAPAGVSVTGPMRPGYEQVLTPEALAFVADLARSFEPRVVELLARRRERQARLEAGEPLDFLPETAGVRAADWRVLPLPGDLLDRRVEITGPTDRKTIINALNSGANVFMADFEDANAPTWDNLVQGQLNLAQAVRGTLSFVASDTGKRYELAHRTAVLFVRPRGWHLFERHVTVDGRRVPGALFDFGLFFFHNAREQLARGTRPYFYLPKMESHHEARLWNDVFLRAQRALGIPTATIKATCLVETLPAAFEMDELLWELREHSCGLNCGRWDYIFSFMKKQGERAAGAAVLPDRARLTMDKGFLGAYVDLLIKTCHRRNVHAMGGMAAQIPVKHDPTANRAALDLVRADKLREVRAGHDGTWVAHPGLVEIAKQVFDAHMPGPHQIAVKRDDVRVTRDDLLRVPAGACSEEGLRTNVRVFIRYMESWLRGVGCVPLYDVMEDAATAEISRAQVWQWLRQRAVVGGEPLSVDRFARVVEEEMQRIRREVGDARMHSGRFQQARELFVRLSTAPRLEEFLTLPAYELLGTN